MVYERDAGLKIDPHKEHFARVNSKLSKSSKRR